MGRITKFAVFLLGACAVQRTLLHPGYCARTSPGPGSMNASSAEQKPISPTAAEAPTSFDLQTNGFVDQATMDAAREVFEEVETVADGIGPVFNGDSCAACHAQPAPGGHSLVVETRAGYFDGHRFIEHPGGSLIHSFAIDPAIQETILPGYNVRALRASPGLFGLGYIEALDNRTLKDIATRQQKLSHGRIAGQIIRVDVLEAPGQRRPGRFGWKNQHASLLSFSSDAYLNEMGITNPLNPVENTANGASVAAYDTVPDPEDDGIDLLHFATFIRSLKAPPREAALAVMPTTQAGEQLFRQIGCELCHTSSLTTARPGTVINGGTFIIPPALGNKTIHPYSDFLLHDVGTGDGIVQNGGQRTRNKIRTAPLWGLHVRERFMHDAESQTYGEAILRHRGEAEFVIDAYHRLTPTQERQLEQFLKSL
jgi:CxxC motif-containing protein (DUF1111 family)